MELQGVVELQEVLHDLQAVNRAMKLVPETARAPPQAGFPERMLRAVPDSVHDTSSVPVIVAYVVVALPDTY